MICNLIFIGHFELGYVTDREVKRRESKLRDALKMDGEFQVKDGATVEVAQVRFSINKSNEEKKNRKVSKIKYWFIGVFC